MIHMYTNHLAEREPPAPYFRVVKQSPSEAPDDISDEPDRVTAGLHLAPRLFWLAPSALDHLHTRRAQNRERAQTRDGGERTRNRKPDYSGAVASGRGELSRRDTR